MSGTYWLETLGCPKNAVDSDKLAGTLVASGMQAAPEPSAADVVVVNTCAFIEAARQESIDVVLALADAAPSARLVVTGCLAERYGDELAEALPEVDVVAGFGTAFLETQRTGAGLPTATPAATVAPPVAEAVPVRIGARPGSSAVPDFDLLNLPRPAATAPWAYLKVAEGCDRACGFCAIPSFRGPQRSRSINEVLAEAAALDAREVVLVAQDLAAYGRDQGVGDRQLVPLVRTLSAATSGVDRVRLLYLYPSDLTDELVDAVVGTGVPYFDLSLQHVSRPLLRRMRRWGDADRFAERIEAIRRIEPDAVFRSSFIVGYPGETEADHAALVDFVRTAQLDWCGLFAFSPEDGTYAAGLDGVVPPALVAERLAELGEIADAITSTRRDALVGTRTQVLVDAPGVARSWREAPEIDGVVVVPDDLPVGSLVDVEVTGSLGTDLEARPVAEPDPWVRREAPAGAPDGESTP
jgi:ribosomal protein S12 methylthiotransferase